MHDTITIALEAATPGMILEAPVQDARGTMLVPRGAELSASLLASLERRGIAQVCVRAPRLPEAEQAARAALRQTLEARLDRTFRHAAADPLGALLRDAVLAYRLEQG